MRRVRASGTRVNNWQRNSRSESPTRPESSRTKRGCWLPSRDFVYDSRPRVQFGRVANRRHVTVPALGIPRAESRVHASPFPFVRFRSNVTYTGSKSRIGTRSRFAARCPTYYSCSTGCSQSARYHSGYGQITSNTESLFEPSSAQRVITYRSLVAVAFAKLTSSAVNKCATIDDLYLSVARIAIKLRRTFAPIKPTCSRASRKLPPDVVADACP